VYPRSVDDKESDQKAPEANTFGKTDERKRFSRKVRVFAHRAHSSRSDFADGHAAADTRDTDRKSRSDVADAPLTEAFDSTAGALCVSFEDCAKSAPTEKIAERTATAISFLYIETPVFGHHQHPKKFFNHARASKRRALLRRFRQAHAIYSSLRRKLTGQPIARRPVYT